MSESQVAHIGHDARLDVTKFADATFANAEPMVGAMANTYTIMSASLDMQPRTLTCEHDEGRYVALDA